MIHTPIKLTGALELRLEREDGSIEVTTVENLVLTAGKGVVADRMKAVPTTSHFTHMAVGTGSSPVNVNDIGLAAEIARVVLGAATVAAAVVTYTAQFGPGVGTGALQEAGIFNAPAGSGVELCRTLFAIINKAAGDTLNVTWTVTVG
jgi:hypothetical protein